MAEASSAPLPADDDLKAALAQLLAQSDLQSTTEKQLRKQLEVKFGVDLTVKKALIRQAVEEFLATEAAPEAEAAAEEEPAGAADGGAGDDVSDADAAPKRRRGGGGGAVVLSPEMAAFLGSEPPTTRPQVVKAIWDYIKGNNLQDPKDRRKILLDDKLRTLFKPPVTMFSMNKQLGRHVMSAKAAAAGKPFKGKKRARSDDADVDEASDGSQQDEEDDDEDEEDGSDGAPAKKRAKKKASSGRGTAGKTGGFSKPLGLSPELAEFLGVSGPISRPELTSKMWAYFKENRLQDPADKRFIISDERLQRLFEVDRFQAFGIQKLLKPHLKAA